MDEMVTRFFDNILGRLHGPMNVRLLLQPLMAVIFAVRDGLKDARSGRPAYGWALFTNADHRRDLIRQGWKGVGKVFIIALALDAIYQFITVKWFYPGEALLVAFVLALVPYVLLRGPVNRVFGAVSKT
jgi:hypothetical protein